MDDKSALEKLEKKLDSRHQDGETKIARSRLFSRGGSTKTAWKRPDLTPRTPRKVNWLEVAFIASVVFFVAAALFATYLFFSGNNTVSTRNVSIAIDGPTEIRAGDVLPLQVVVTNRNAVPMELADLVVEFPPGTRSETDVSLELPRLRESLGTINPGESVNRTIRSVIFGSADTNADIKVTVEYRVPSSNAIFFGEEEYSIPIASSPASIVIEGLEELVSGQETSLTVTVTSNVTGVLNDMLLVADYPPGFAFTSSSPKPFSGESVWRLGDIEAGGERTISIRGSFSGEDGDERVIKFETGSEKENVEGELAAPLATGDRSITLAKPFVSASLALGGSITTEYIASRGDAVRADVRYINNLPSRVQDVEIEVTLNGAILDKNSVDPDRGFYNSNQNTITWNKETNPELANLAPGASNVLTFALASLPLENGTFRNPEIDLSVKVRARRISEANVPEAVESISNARIVIATDLLLQSALAAISGPNPPRVEEETTYIINWIASNNTNAVANASVSAVLPSYVEWVGSDDPNVSFNEVGGIITWTVGGIEAGELKNTSLSVKFTPSLSQSGDVPTIISDQRIYGFDRFTRSQIERALPILTVGQTVVE